MNRFCRIRADSGYNDRWDVHYVLFGSRTLEETGESRDDLLLLTQTPGLERVDVPPGSATGEVWVRTDPRSDAELENAGHSPPQGRCATGPVWWNEAPAGPLRPPGP